MILVILPRVLHLYITAVLQQQLLTNQINNKLSFSVFHILFLFQEIISKNSTPDSGGGPLAPAYLLSLMIDHASKHLDPALTPQLLLKAANQIKAIVWVRINNLLSFLKRIKRFNSYLFVFFYFINVSQMPYKE